MTAIDAPSRTVQEVLDRALEPARDVAHVS